MAHEEKYDELRKDAEKFSFSISDDEVKERIYFGRFEVVKTAKGIMYRHYTGYFVFVTPYAVDRDGKARKASLYRWLDDLIAIHRMYSGHESEPLDDEGMKCTKGDFMDALRNITEANLSYPLTAFIDQDRATKLAIEQLEWLQKQQEELQAAMSAGMQETDEDLAANAEFEASRERAEEVLDAMSDAENE